MFYNLESLLTTKYSNVADDSQSSSGEIIDLTSDDENDNKVQNTNLELEESKPSSQNIELDEDCALRSMPIINDSSTDISKPSSENNDNLGNYPNAPQLSNLTNYRMLNQFQLYNK